MRRRLAPFVLAILCLAGGESHAAPSGQAFHPPGVEHARADSAGTNAIILRRERVQQLELAVHDAPADARLRIELGHAYLDANFTAESRGSFERAAALAPELAEAPYGLALGWKRDWLEMLAPHSLARAIDALEHALRLDPGYSAAWTLLAVLEYEHGNAARADMAAHAALTQDPDGMESRLVSAYLDYRLGRVREADSLFQRVMPQLPRELAARFSDVTPLVPPEVAEQLARADEAERYEYARRFWSETDPDQTLPQNLARLEYWSRVAHATLLFSDPANPRWDARAELYVRYGAPGAVQYQPLGVPMAERPNKYGGTYVDDPLGGAREAGDPIHGFYDLHTQVWHYPSLRMSILLKDITVSQHYEFPRETDFVNDPRPDPVLVEHAGLVAAPGNRAVFRTLPPGGRKMQFEGKVARFESGSGDRLLAQFEIPATPADSLVAECVVVDSSEHERARQSLVPGVSACDAAALRFGEFAFDLPPGSYRVTLAVHDPHGGRGVLRLQREVEPHPAVLALSDLVPVCGPSDATLGSDAVRLHPNLRASVQDHEPLFAYFEVYHLNPGADGHTHFGYEYTVQSLDRDLRPWYQRLLPGASVIARLAVKSTQEGYGPTRRQYISVPTTSLPRGRYRLKILVRDSFSRASVQQSVDFMVESSTLPAREPVAP
jgi:GWxTD domain-containing protein